MLALTLSLLSISSAISSFIVIALIVREARKGCFPPRSHYDRQVTIYAGLLVTVLALLAYTAKEAALDLIAQTLAPL